MKINLKKVSQPIKINQKKFFDQRGYFQEIFLKKYFNLDVKFTALAKSKKNVIRGLHFQIKNQQTKLLHVTEGKIIDVVINLKMRFATSFCHRDNQEILLQSFFTRQN